MASTARCWSSLKGQNTEKRFTDVSWCINWFLHLYIYIYICAYMYMFTSIYIYIYIFIYTYVYMCLYIQTCIYIYVYTYIYIHVYVTNSFGNLHMYSYTCLLSVSSHIFFYSLMSGVCIYICININIVNIHSSTWFCIFLFNHVSIQSMIQFASFFSCESMFLLCDLFVFSVYTPSHLKDPLEWILASYRRLEKTPNDQISAVHNFFSHAQHSLKNPGISIYDKYIAY